MICEPVRLGMSASVPHQGDISQIDSRSDLISTTDNVVRPPDTARIRGSDPRFSVGPVLETTPRQRGALMKIQWTLAVLLSSAITAGCGDRGTNDANLEENTALPPATAPAPDE